MELRIESDALISGCGRYRYTLTRTWDSRPTCLFVMLNPSTADASIDDPTIRRCVRFAAGWDFGGVIVVNVYAFRATKPADLWRTEDPIGPSNRRHIGEALQRTALTVAAWGNNARPHDAIHVYWQLMEQRPVHCLGVTGKGFPKHPLYIRKDTEPALYEVSGSSGS